MLIVRAMRRRLAGDAGFTLIELMVTILIGMVVLIGLMNLIDTTGRANARLTDRAETAQRVRVGVERIARVLRTQACLDATTPPLVEGSADSVTFYSDMPTRAQVDAGQDDTNIIFKPKRVRLTYSSAGTGSITQETWTTNAGFPAGSYDTTTSPPQAGLVSRVLINNVRRQRDINNNEVPIFRYYTFSALDTPLTSLNSDLGADPVPASSVKRVVKMNVALEGTPESRNPGSTRNTDAEATVLTRNADLSGGADPGRQWGPRCG